MGQASIKNRLMNLEEIENVSVTSTDGKGTIKIQHAKHHGLEFMFRWSSDHFIGYFIDSEKNKSQAVISLYSDLDAIKFSAAYSMLLDIRANQRA